MDPLTRRSVDGEIVKVAALDDLDGESSGRVVVGETEKELRQTVFVRRLVRTGRGTAASRTTG